MKKNDISIGRAANGDTIGNGNGLRKEDVYAHQLDEEVKRNTSELPLVTAMCNGVDPSESKVTLTSALLSRSILHHCYLLRRPHMLKEYHVSTKHCILHIRHVVMHTYIYIS